VGATYEGSDLVWAADAQGLSIWSSDGLVADADDDEVRLFEGAFDTNDVTRVLSFNGEGDDDDLHGVRIVIGANLQVTVTASADGSAGPEDSSREWASFLGHDLAMWFLAPHDDAIAETSNAIELQLAVVAHRLADRIEQAPTRGAFTHLTESVGPLETATDVSFHFGVSPFDADLRYIELVVQSRSPKRTLKTGRWVRKGTNDRIAAFLRDARSPRRILRRMREILMSQRKSDYA
jgi:hypothetical protein